MSVPDLAGEIDFFDFGLDSTTGFGGTFEGTTVLGCRSGIILDAFRFLGGGLVFVELFRSVESWSSQPKSSRKCSRPRGNPHCTDRR